MFGAVLLVGLLGAGGDVPEMTATRVAQSHDDLARYAKSHDLHDLEAAVSDLDGTIDLDSMSAENFTATRRVLVTAWVTAIKVVEGAYDPTFDPKDPKNRFPGCMPPPTPVPSGAPLVPQGIDTVVISCPNQAEINRRSSYYFRVSRADRLAITGLEASLKMLNGVAPIGLGFDYEALDQIVRQSAISSAARTEIEQAMVESGPHNVHVPMHTSDHDVPAGTAQTIDASSIALARYSSSHALRDLEQAVDALDKPVDIDSLKWNFEKTRDALVRAWGTAITRIEESYGPALSPDSYILVRRLDNRAIASLVALLRQFNGDCSSCAQSSADLDKLLQQAGLSQATRTRIVAGTARMLPLASP